MQLVRNPSDLMCVDRDHEEPTMKLFHAFCCLTVFVGLLTVAGCSETKLNSDIPKEKLAPKAEELGNNPDYAKQFGSKKK